MNTLEEFKSYLLQSKKKHSKSTIKNYLADINKFIKWNEKNSQSAHNFSKINIETIKLYKLKLDKDKIAPSSTERYLSSLRLFFTFLKSKNLIRQSPFDLMIDGTKPARDPLFVNDFKLYLLDENISKVTIKNYMMDVSQFTDWLTNEAQTNEPSLSAINEYRYKLINEAKLAPSSVNRKLSSIRKYLSWVSKKEIKNKNIKNKKFLTTTGLNEKTNF